MNFKAVILKKETGECRVPKDTYDNVYLWSDGNNSCDCNRAILFERVKGLDPEDDELQCSDGKFLVNLVDAQTGEIIYQEF